MLAPLLFLALAAPAPATDATDPAALVAEAREEARAIVDLAGAADRPAVRREIRRKAEHIQEILDRLAALPGGGQVSLTVVDPGSGAVLATPGVAVTTGPGGVTAVVGGAGVADLPEQAPPAAMDGASFAALLRAVEDASFGDEKVALVREAAARNAFSTGQVRALLEAFDFDQDRVDAAVALYPATVDPENWHVVYAAFDFDASRAEVRRRIGR